MLGLLWLIQAAAPAAAQRAPQRAPAPPGPGDILRRLCAGWSAQPRDPEPLEADFRPQPLRYLEGGLRLPLSQPAQVEDGPRGMVEIFPSPGAPEEAAAPLAIEEGARLIRAQAQGKLSARMAFAPDPGPLTGSPCLVLSGGRVVRVRVMPLWVRLSVPGQAPVFLYTEPGEALLPGGQPQVLFDPREVVFSGDPHDGQLLGPALQPLQARALGCYRQALEKTAGLSGRVILGADTDKEGQLAGARVEVDAIGDEALARCLREGLLALRLPRLKRPGHLSVPLSLRRVR
jgi:hypothetical protein